MKNLKQKMLAMVLMLLLALAVTACGGSGSLSGTFVAEGDEDSGMSLVFRSNNRFSLVVESDVLGLGLDDAGDFSLDGRFSVNNSANTVSLTIDDASVRSFVRELVDVVTEQMMAEDPDLADDPLAAAFMDSMIEMFEEMFEEMAQELADELTNVELTFESNFDRLYSDDGVVFVRR